MANRFSDINRGPQLAKAYDELQNWRKLDATARKAAYNAVKKTTARVKVEYVTAYIVPFSVNRADIFYQGKVPAATQVGTGDECSAVVRAAIDTRYKTTAPANATDTLIEKLPQGFVFAKVRATRRVGDPNVNAVSRITKRPYTRISTESVSGSFGQATGATTFEAAKRAIKGITAVETFSNAVGQSIAIIPEQS